MATFQLDAVEISGQTGLTLSLRTGGSSAFAATGVTVTEDGSTGYFEASPTVSDGWYFYYVIQSSVAIYRGEVTFVGGVGVADKKVDIRLYPPLYRSANDTNPIFFDWVASGDTITGTVVKTEGGTTGSSQAIQGAITSTGSTVVIDNVTYYQYKLAYHADDRTTAEGSVQYTLTGTSGNGGRFDLQISPNLEGLSWLGTSAATITVPVSSQGKIAQIFIGDDYLAANGRAFRWTIDEPTGFIAGTSTASFGGSDGNGNTWLVSGTITDLGTTWRIEADLPKSATADLDPGMYEWTVEVKNASGTEHTIAFGGDTKLRRKYT